MKYIQTHSMFEEGLEAYLRKEGFEEAYFKKEEIVKEVSLSFLEARALLQEYELRRWLRIVYSLTKERTPCSFRDEREIKRLLESGEEKFRKRGYEPRNTVRWMVELMETKEGCRIPVVLRRPGGKRTGRLYFKFLELGKNLGEEVEIVGIQCLRVPFDRVLPKLYVGRNRDRIMYSFRQGYIGIERDGRKMSGVYIPILPPPEVEWVDINIQKKGSLIIINGIDFNPRVTSQLFQLAEHHQLPISSARGFITRGTFSRLEEAGVIQVWNNLVLVNPEFEKKWKRIRRKFKMRKVGVDEIPVSPELEKELSFMIRKSIKFK